MFKVTLFALLTVVGVAFGSVLPDSGRIVGGLTAAPGQFKYQVSLRLPGNFHTCGATIVNSRWLITAAHCTGTPSQYKIIVGTTSITATPEVYNVRRFIDHPQWNPNGIVNDIALVEVDGNINFNSNVQPVSFSNRQVPAGQNAVVSGWGQTSHPGSAAQTLQYLNTKTVDCEPYRICTFSKQGEGACFGDSGGPLVSNGELIGVVSAVVPCAIGYNDIFTRVSYFYSWIVSYTG